MRQKTEARGLLMALTGIANAVVIIINMGVLARGEVAMLEQSAEI